MAIKHEKDIKELSDKNSKLEKDVINAERDKDRLKKDSGRTYFFKPLDFKGKYNAKCVELDKTLIRLKALEEKLSIAETKLSSQSRKTDDEKVNLLRSMNILKEEIREKDREIKQLLEEAKGSEPTDDLIDKSLISKYLLQPKSNFFFIEGVLIKYFSLKQTYGRTKIIIKSHLCQS